MILVHILVGVCCASLLFLFWKYSIKNAIRLSILSWILILLQVIYTGFVLELIIGFLEEGSPRAALVMGMLFGFISIIGIVLIFRFILRKT